MYTIKPKTTTKTTKQRITANSSTKKIKYKSKIYSFNQREAEKYGKKVTDLNIIRLVPVLSKTGLNTPSKRQTVRLDKNARPKYMWLTLSVL